MDGVLNCWVCGIRSFGTERALRQHERHCANRINDLVENENNHANLDQNGIIQEAVWGTLSIDDDIYMRKSFTDVRI